MGIKAKVWRNDYRRRGRETQARIIEAIENSIIVGEQMARQFCPVETGFLQSTIHVLKWPRPGSLIGIFGTTGEADYDIYQEFGTSRMPAQPYIAPAAEEARKMFLREARGVMK